MTSALVGVVGFLLGLAASKAGIGVQDKASPSSSTTTDDLQ